MRFATKAGRLVLVLWAVSAVLPATAFGVGFIGPTNFAALPNNDPEAVAVADFNADGDPDLAVTSNGPTTSDNVSILLGGAGGTFALPASPPFAYTVGSIPSSIAVGQFNGDLDPDLAVVNRGSSNVSILLGSTNATFTGPTNFSAGSGPNDVAVGNFEGDCDQDLAVARTDGSVGILLGDTGGGGCLAGVGNFTPPIDFAPAAAAGPSTVAVGNFDTDSFPDLAIANEGTDNVSIRFGAAPTGGGVPVFSAATNLPVGDRPTDVAVGDFQGDTDPDLAVTNDGSDSVSVLMGAPGGAFAAATNYGTADHPSSVLVGNFAGDSDPDLAVANENSATVSILLGAVGGTFSAAGQFSVGSFPQSVAGGDFNADGDLDLVTPNLMSDNVSVLLQTQGYARPIGATPTRVTLVPAYAACTAPNRVHGPPLASGSCNPPTRTAAFFLTVGTFDANGQAPNSTGYVRYDVVPGDVQIAMSLSDVRNDYPPYSDYELPLQLRQGLRITDRASGPAGTHHATLEDTTFVVDAPCFADADTTVGAGCQVFTTVNAVVPGAVVAGKRANWELAQARIYAPPLPDVVAVQGLFVP